MRARIVLCFLQLFASLFVATISSAQSGDFTIIALPDTQNEADRFPGVLAAQTQWIATHQQELNIQMVLGEGDIVNDFSSPAQQQSADAAFGTLDQAGVPYLLAIGNHDYDGADPKEGRPVSGFNRFFGPARYAGKTYYQGSFPAGSNENFFGVVEIGGQPFLFLIVEYYPRPSSMDWAESILQANPDKQVIVVTHSFTFIDNTRVDRCDTHDMPAGNLTGEDMWATLRKYPNVSMVLSGHLTAGQAARRVDQGDQGNLVNQVFTNFQTFPHGGDGWLRIMTFHPAANTITVRTFSPSLNRFRTDDDNQFTLAFRNPHVSRRTGTISGLVRDFSTCEPIAGAQVSSGGASAVSDAKGHYSMTLVPGTYQVAVSAPGRSADLKTEFVNDSFNTDLNFYPRGGALCPSIGATPAVTICSPREGATVPSPVEITAGAVAAKQVISIAAEVDGKEVLDSEGANLDGFVELASGPHQLTVVARDAANAILQQTTKFVVGGSPAPPDRRLSIGVTPAKASISLGESANFVVSVGSDGGLTDQVTFACSNLPAGAQCSFEPSGMSAVNLPTTTKMKLSTKPLETGGVQIRRRLALAAILLIGVALVGAPRGYAKLLCSVLLAIALVGCAGLVEPTNRGTFTVTVVGKSGAVKKTVNIDLTLE